ncbi:MAG: YabP/YqfC family sporulation protein [Clostridia bacterium]|nr:YabP/YqfC family sporulation protein [Clostridia bacterium]
MAEKRKKRELIPPQKGNCITVENCRRLIMEGVERIVFCDSEKMILKGAFSLTVEGEGLYLRELGNFNMEILGKICAIYFGEGGNE